MKMIIIITTLLLSNSVFGMFILHTAYSSGCVQSRVYDLGMTHGSNFKHCKDLTKNKEFHSYKFSNTKLIIEEATFLFFKGCILGNISSKEKTLYEKCHRLTISYHNDISSIILKKF